MKVKILIGIVITAMVMLFLGYQVTKKTEVVQPDQVVTESNVVTDEELSAEASDAAYQDGSWWRDIRKGMWEWEGADWPEIESALDKIKNAKGERRYEDKVDTIIKYGPGHWTYEWTIIAENAYKEGLKYEKDGDESEALKSYMKSSIYYTQASYPHMQGEHSKAASTKAFEMYAKAGRYFPVPLETWNMEVDGVQFVAFVHLPAKKSSKSDLIPVILKTGGMDVMSTEFYPLSKMINDTGAAVILFDTPGTGNEGIVDENYDKHHIAVLEKVLKDDRFDKESIGVWSESLAGLTAVKMAIGEYKDNIAASVNSCGPVHALFALELTGPMPSQYDIPETLKAYRSGQLSKAQIDEFNEAALTPPLNQMLHTFQAETFVDRVGGKELTNVLDILSRSLPVSLVEQGVLGKNVTDTPLLTTNTHADPLVPLSESQLATNVSTQGELFICNEYGGHCLSRDALPIVIDWLSKYLNIDVK